MIHFLTCFISPFCDGHTETAFKHKCLQRKKMNRAIPKLVCYTAVFSIVTQRSSLRDDSKNGCVADYFQTSLGYVSAIPDSFAPARNPYLTRLLFTHKNNDFGAISVTKRSCAAPISKGESHIIFFLSDRCSYNTE